MSNNPFGTALVAALLLGCVGCGDGKPQGELPPLHPVRGKALRGGTPLTTGLLRFTPSPETLESRDWLITAEINADGTFEVQSLHSLSQKRGVGAPAGAYRVNVTISGGDQTQGGRILNLTLPSPVTVEAKPNDLSLDFPKGR
ncbi:MAG: hypothetical protein N2039_00540 [Gemmataceae bacterium]|nr:hypothetical protein [Gemmataceae bacterium]